MQPEEFALLRSLVEWRRANGWSHRQRREEFLSRHQWRNGPYVADLHVDAVKSLWFTQLKSTGGGSPRIILRPKSIRQAVDALAALGVLPATFSSAFAAGRESAYTTDEWRVMVPEKQGPAIWCRSFSEEIGRADRFQARRENPNAWLEHRRSGATDWSRVDA